MRITTGNGRIHWLPAGKSFAVALVDDADGSHHDGVRLVYDLMTSLGLRATRTVWPLRAISCSGPHGDIHDADTLEDPRYRRYCERLKASGHELAMHGASSGNNTRERVIAAYDLFERVFGEPPAVNVMHGRNFENIYWGRSHFGRWTERLVALHEPQRFYGHVRGSPYFWGDICREKTRYVRFHETLGADVGSFDPATPYHDPTKPFVSWWFSAAYGAGSRVLELLSPRSLEALRERQSFSIIHFYSAHQLVRDTSGQLAVDPRFAAAMKRLAATDGAWVVPASTLLDRIRAIRDLSAELTPGHVVLANHSSAPLRDLTINVAGSTHVLDVEHDARLELPASKIRAIVKPRAVAPRKLRLLTGTLQRTAWKYHHRFDPKSAAPLARAWTFVMKAVGARSAVTTGQDIWVQLAARANAAGRAMIAGLAADHLWGPPTALALERVGDLAGKSVIDLGCGRGQLAVVFAIMGAEVRGFDIDARRLETARDLAARCGVAERCDFELGRSETVPAGDGLADLVFSRTALQYTDRHTVLRECRRLLKPGGRLVVIENLPANPFVLAYRLSRRLRARTPAQRAYVDSIKGYVRLDEIAALRGPFEDLDVRVFHLASTLTAFAQPTRWRRVKLALGRLDERLLRGVPALDAAGWIVVVTARRASSS